MTFDPQVLSMMAVTCGGGYLLMVGGVLKNGLEWRRPRRFCPSCGRERSVCACG